MWKACDLLLYPAGPTYSSSDSLYAATWCILLFLRPIPNMLFSKCKTVIFCSFRYFFCTSWRIAKNIFFGFEHSDDSDPMSDKVLICAETGGKHTHCLPIAFTVHGGRLPIPLCYFLSKIKRFEDPMFVQYFRLLEMSVAPKRVSTSWVKVFLGGLSEARVFIVISVHEKLLFTSV